MRRPLVALVALAVLAALAARPRDAAAHAASFTYGALTAHADGRGVDYRLDLRTTDLAEALGLPPDDPAAADPDDASLLAGADRVQAYVAARVALTAPGQACATTRAPPVIVRQTDRFLRLRWTLRCPAPIDGAVLDYGLFYDLDAGHVGLVTVDGETVQLRAPDESRLEWDLGAPPPGDLLGFLASGLHHIAIGLDHILFLVALLLVAPIRRGPGGGVVRRPTRAALRYAALVVTAFTLAHSLTLAAAALGWFALPARLVESAIAASIAVVAIEDVVRPDPPRRALVTVGFGLVHGLGFAAMLAPELPRGEVVLPLLAFNLGVELGQLVVVAAVLPLLALVAARLGPDRYHRTVVRGVAAVLVAFAAVWLLERAFGLALLG